MSSFYEFDFYQEKDINLPFSFHQDEIVLINGTTNKFKKSTIEYKCFSSFGDGWDIDKPTAIITIHNGRKLLDYTCKNLSKFNVDKTCNILIVDDRSEEELQTIVKAHGYHYVRVDNEKGFNFSMLNNIGAYVANKLGTKEIILWNSDLWCHDEETVPKILKLHRDNESIISGTKLVYPPIDVSFNKQQNSENIKATFPNKLDSWRETVQFGGSFWFNGGGRILPNHYKRFADKEDCRVNCNKGESFITGAFQVYDREWFISSGGLNPSLSKNLQDVETCLKVLEEGKNIFYFGKDLFLYHDESLSLHKENKFDHQMKSDHVLFSKLWNNKLSQMVF